MIKCITPLLLFIGLAWGQSDIYDVYTTESQLGLTITNFGVLGNGWNKIDGHIQPSCMYKQNTEILREQVEHFSYAGLWIGGKVNGERRVSTAIVDGVFESGQEGFEFFSMSGIDVTSEISDQDIITGFKDYGENASDNLGIPNHNPLGIQVELKAFSWDFAPVDPFVILEYEITNATANTIQDIYAGMWVEASVANFNYTDKYTPGGGFSWYDNLDGFDESVDAAGFTRDIGYQYDADGDHSWAESYIGISSLGSNVPKSLLETNYSQWVWTNSNNSDYPAYSMPLDDNERYEKMTSSVPTGSGSDYTSEGYPSSANSWIFLVSTGPLGSTPANVDSTSWELPAGESCRVVLTVVAARWFGGGGETEERRSHLHTNMDWAQKVYDGEDLNRNNQLDDGEDIFPNGELDRYLLPPQPTGNLTAVWQYPWEYPYGPVVTLNWDPPEEPVTGYNIYKSHEQYGSYSLLNDSLVTLTKFFDESMNNDSTSSYFIVSVNDIGWESSPSNIIKDYSLPPEISFRYLSNPKIADIGGDTSFTFPTRTFILDIYDLDGNETITDIFYALDDTCGNCWNRVDPDSLSITLTEIAPGVHTFFAKAVDNFDMSSSIIQFPDSTITDEAQVWNVLPVQGDVLLVDDFPNDSQNNAQDWYQGILDSLLGSEGFSVWEIGEELPYSTTDLNANLNYFNTVIWYSAYSGKETYDEAGSSIYAFLSGGGNIFVNAPELKDTSFVWFPIDSTFTLNPSGRLLTGRVLESQIDSTLNLEVSRLIAIRVKGYENNEEDHPYFQSLYRLQEPGGEDEWEGTPNVCASYQFEVGVGQLSGKAVLMTLPLHNGSYPVLEGNGSAGKFLGYLLEEEFASSIINRQEVVGPPRLKVDPSYPNPFNPITTLRYDLAEDGLVKITIYDLMGREVKRLVNSEQTAGYKSIQWDATNDAGSPVSAGLYLYTIQVGEFRQTKKMVLMK